MSEPSSSRPDRGIGSIAHFFLTQGGEHPPETPLRKPPSAKPIQSSVPASTSGNNSPEEKSPDHATAQVSTESPGGEPMAADGPEILLGEALLADHLDESWERVCTYVSYLRQQQERVALVNIDACEARLIEDPSDIHSDRGDNAILAETEDVAGALIPTLNELVESHDILLAHLDRSFRERAGELIKNCTWVTVLCTCRKAEIVETYQTIKWLVQEIGWGEKIYLYLCDVPGETDEAIERTATEVFEKIAHTSREFLKVELQLTGFEEKLSPGASSNREADKVEREGGGEVSKEEGATREKGGNIRFDTEYREDMSEEAFSEEEEPAENDFARLVTEPEGKAEERPGGGGACRPQVLTPIPVQRLPLDDIQLGDQLHLHLTSWLEAVPGALVLAVPLPSEWDSTCRVLVDGTGRLYVLLAALSGGDEVWGRALRSLKWIRENGLYIQRAAPQIRIDRGLSPGVILVAGGRLDLLRAGGRALSDAPCYFYGCHFLQQGSDWSLVIISN